MIVADRIAHHPENARSLVLSVIRLRLLSSAAVGALLVGKYFLGNFASLAVPLLMTLSIVAEAVPRTTTAALRGLGTVLADSLHEACSRIFVRGVGGWLLLSGSGIAVPLEPRRLLIFGLLTGCRSFFTVGLQSGQRFQTRFPGDDMLRCLRVRWSLDCSTPASTFGS